MERAERNNKISESGHTIYHGGCIGCIANKNLCGGCQFMKPDWSLPNHSEYRKTLQDYERRDKFIIKYIEAEISKIENFKYEADIWQLAEQKAKRSVYKDILFKLTKK